MALVDNGEQIITFRYRHPLTAEYHNTAMRDGVPAGVYHGAEFFSNSLNILKISPFVLYTKVDPDKIVRIETRTDVTLNVQGLGNVTTPQLLYVSYTWQNNIQPNFADFSFQPVNQPIPVNCVPLGTLYYDSNGDLVDFTYERRLIGHNKGFQLLEEQGFIPGYSGQIDIGTGTAERPESIVFINLVDTQIQYKVEFTWGTVETTDMITEMTYYLSYDSGSTFRKLAKKVNTFDANGNYLDTNWE